MTQKVKTVKNTSNENPELTLRRTLIMGQTGAIEHQEAQGQRELCASEVLPMEGSNSPDIQALGIEWGEPVLGDGLFRYAKLPEGWSKRPTEHSMWSEIVDAEGAVKAQAFYKAAFYDRKAFISAVESKP